MSPRRSISVDENQRKLSTLFCIMIVVGTLCGSAEGRYKTIWSKPNPNTGEKPTFDIPDWWWTKDDGNPLYPDEPPNHMGGPWNNYNFGNYPPGADDIAYTIKIVSGDCPTVVIREYALDSNGEPMEFEALYDELGLGMNQPGSPNLYVPIPFADFDEDGIADDTTLYVAIDLRTYYLSNPTRATTPIDQQPGEFWAEADGVVMPGIYAAMRPFDGLNPMDADPIMRNKKTKGYIWEIATPEPATGFLLILGGLVLVRRRTR